MNVLFYVEPWIDKALPHWRDLWIDRLLAPLEKKICTLENWDFFFLIGDAQIDAATEAFPKDHGQTGVLFQKELRKIFPDYMSASLAWYNEDYTADQLEKMMGLVQSKMNGFKPDIIFSWFTSVPFLKKLYPEAMILYMDYACFSRPPFPVCMTLDPCGMLKNGFLAKFSQEILKKPLDKKEKLFLHFFRKKYVDRLLIPKTPISKGIVLGNKSFKHLILLPLQTSGTFAFEGNCEFKNQWDMVCYVMDNIRPDIGVIVTEHSDWHRLFSPTVLAYLRHTYPNFIYHELIGQCDHVSQYLLQYVDAVAAVSTSIALQAMLWKKPICALGSCHVNSFADIDKIECLGDYLDQGSYLDKDSLLSYILTRFNFPTPEYNWEMPRTENRLMEWYDRYRSHGVDADFFTPIDNLFRLLKHYFRHTDANIPTFSEPEAKI